MEMPARMVWGVEKAYEFQVSELNTGWVVVPFANWKTQD